MKYLLDLLLYFIDSLAPYFYYIVYIFYLLYVGLYLGLDKKYEKILLRLKTGIRIFIGIFLLLHFNPYVKNRRLTELDTKIILSSAIVIILDAGVSAFIEDKLQEYKTKIKEEKNKTNMLILQ